jgi:hypothetical protein
MRRSLRASVSATLGLLTSARVVADDQPADPLARRVVLLDADAGQVASLHASLPADSILEPAVRRYLHRLVSIELRPAVPHVVTYSWRRHCSRSEWPPIASLPSLQTSTASMIVTMMRFALMCLARSQNSRNFASFASRR